MTRMPSSGAGPSRHARRATGSARARTIAGDARATPSDRATSDHTISRRRRVIQPTCSGRAMSSAGPACVRMRNSPERSSTLTSGAGPTGQGDRGAGAAPAAARNEIEELGLLTADRDQGHEGTTRNQLAEHRLRRSTVQPNRWSQRSSPASTLAIIGFGPRRVSARRQLGSHACCTSTAVGRAVPCSRSDGRPRSRRGRRPALTATTTPYGCSRCSRRRAAGPSPPRRRAAAAVEEPAAAATDRRPCGEANPTGSPPVNRMVARPGRTYRPGRS